MNSLRKLKLKRNVTVLRRLIGPFFVVLMCSPSAGAEWDLSNIRAKQLKVVGMQQVTRGEVDDWWPNWSHDGTRIAFQRNWDIWTMNVDGSNQTQVTRGKFNEGSPAWSPDGRRIAFSSNREGRYHIWIIDLGRQDSMF